MPPTTKEIPPRAPIAMVSTSSTDPSTSIIWSWVVMVKSSLP